MAIPEPFLSGTQAMSIPISALHASLVTGNSLFGQRIEPVDQRARLVPGGLHLKQLLLQWQGPIGAVLLLEVLNPASQHSRMFWGRMFSGK